MEYIAHISLLLSRGRCKAIEALEYHIQTGCKNTLFITKHRNQGTRSMTVIHSFNRYFECLLHVRHFVGL